jgi:hypothetical protein
MTTLARPQVLQRRDSAGLIGALITGTIGALFGFGAFLAVVIGDGMIALDATSIAAAGLAVLGLIAAVFVRELPGYSAFGMAAAPVAYLVTYGGNWTTWWAKYQEAVATSGAAENIFWSTMPAMALFAISGALLLIGATLSAIDALSEEQA